MASGVIDKGLRIASSLLKGDLRVTDPSNIDSQVERADLVDPDSEPAVGDAMELYELGEERFDESRQGRWQHNARIFSGIAMFQGKQYDYWDDDTSTMQPIPGLGNRNPDFNERMSRSKWNIIRVMAERTVARIMAAEPDAWAAPLTDSPEDMQAAQIMRAVNAHCAYANNRQELLEKAVLACYISSTCFIEVGWDNNAWATVGMPQLDGTIKYSRQQVGDVHNGLMLCIDAYPDPNCALHGGDIHSGTYFIKRCTRTTTWIQEKWGKTVQATSPTSTYGFLEQRLEWIANDHSRDQAKIKHCTDVTEVWEKPSKRFPEGRFWVYSADKTILWAGKWPYEKKDKYPFVPVKFQDNQASVWALNGVDDLKPIQIDLNDLATYLRARLQWDRTTTFVPDGCGISPEDFNAPALGKIVPFTDEAHGGGLPIYEQPPSPPAWLFEYWKSLITQAEYTAGVRDFNSDAAPPPTSGFEFELRVEEDKSRLRQPIRHMNRVACELMEWDGALYRQFGTQLPRVLGLDDKAIPAGQGAAGALMDLRALKNGNTRVILQPGSGQSKSPAAQEQRLDEIVKILAGANMNPALAEFYLNQSQAIRSDAQVDRFIAGLKGYFAQQQAQAQQVQQMKGQQAQEQLSTKLQAEQAQQQVQAKAEEEREAMKVHSAALTEHLRVQADAYIENLRTKNRIAEMAASAQTAPKISVGFQVKPDPTMTQELGSKYLGVDGNIEESKKMLITPKPSPNQAQKGDSNGSK